MSSSGGSDQSHASAVAAAVEGMRDPALGAGRLDGHAVHLLAEAAVSSATPFVRAPVLAALAAVVGMHRPDEVGRCAECRQPSPCRTAVAAG